MKKRKEELTKGAVIAIFVVAIALVILGFGALILAAYLQDKGVSANKYLLYEVVLEFVAIVFRCHTEARLEALCEV